MRARARFHPSPAGPDHETATRFDNATDRHVARVLAEAVRGVTAATVVSVSAND
jgi:hypothetical protein